MGLIVFTKKLSEELGAGGICVNAILPGAVDDPRFQEVPAGRAHQAEHTIVEATSTALSEQIKASCES